jgi:hypothetical protein
LNLISVRGVYENIIKVSAVIRHKSCIIIAYYSGLGLIMQFFRNLNEGAKLFLYNVYWFVFSIYEKSQNTPFCERG